MSLWDPTLDACEASTACFLEFVEVITWIKIQPFCTLRKPSDVTFQEKNDEIPPEACRTSTKLNKKQCRTSGPPKGKKQKEQCRISGHPTSQQKKTMSNKWTPKMLNKNNAEQVDPQKVEQKRCRTSVLI